MRKIVIDDTVRAFAHQYATGVLAACPKVDEDLNTLKTFVVANNNWTDPKAVEEYIDQLRADYVSLLTLEPKDWDINKYDSILRREPGMLTRKVRYAVKKRDEDGNPTEYYEAKLYERIMFCLRYPDCRSILGGIHQQMGLKACVYCNTQPTRSADGVVFYTLDHFKAQSEYTFLGTCFYNLQPSDGTCNGHKSTQPCDFQLFVNDPNIELSPFKFQPQVVELNKPNEFDCLSIEFLSQNGQQTADSREYDRTFHITELYKAYKDVVVDLYDKNYKMSSSGMVASYKASLGLHATRAEMTNFLLGCPYDENLIHGEVMRKLKYDTMKQLDDAGLLLKEGV